jgi:hypothetical protein
MEQRNYTIDFQDLKRKVMHNFWLGFEKRANQQPSGKYNCFFHAGMETLNRGGKLMRGPAMSKGETAHFWVERDGKIIDHAAKMRDISYPHYHRGEEISLERNIEHLKNDPMFKKHASPKWIKMWRSGGVKNLEEVAHKLNLHPRAIDKLPIAKGSEAVVTRVVHPKHGIAVQKVFDPKSPLVGKKTVEQKIDVMQKLKDHPSMAKFLGKHRNKNLPVIYQEYVKGPSGGAYIKKHPEIKSLQRLARKRGLGSLHDLNPSNVIMSGKTPKVVDFMPYKAEVGTPVTKGTEDAIKKDFIGALQRGFEKKSASTKATYNKVDINTLNPKVKDEVWSIKIDGAHTIVDMEKGKMPLLFSHRISKKTGNPIPYTPKLPHIQKQSPVNAVVRAETYAVDKSGRAVHPDVVTALLNRTVDNSLALQKELGITTRTALIDVDKYEGRDMAHAPYKEKLDILKNIAKNNTDFHLPDMAFTAKDKQKILTKVLSGSHPQSKEGLVVHDFHASHKPFAKAKISDDHDVYITGIFGEEGVKEGRKPMAGGFTYSWDPGGKTVGKVGTGFDHAMKEDMLNNPDKYLGRAARVRALDLSKNKVLVKPSFVGWHVEKNINE